MPVGDHEGIGEWGFSALVEADGHHVLRDTGGHPDTVLQNARAIWVEAAAGTLLPQDPLQTALSVNFQNAWLWSSGYSATTGMLSTRKTK